MAGTQRSARINEACGGGTAASLHPTHQKRQHGPARVSARGEEGKEEKGAEILSSFGSSLSHVSSGTPQSVTAAPPQPVSAQAAGVREPPSDLTGAMSGRSGADDGDPRG